MKSIIQSKLFWAGVAAILGAGLDAYISGGDPRTIVLAIVGALVIFLRRHTSTSVRFCSPRQARQLHAQDVVRRWKTE